MGMVIDCHGHFTTAPAALDAFRAAQLDGQTPRPPVISDDELRESVEGAQLTLMRERGIDLVVFSPKASAMGHHRPDIATAVRWAQVSNDLVHRVATLYPDHFAAAAQLPQTPDGDLTESIRELRRCVTELGFVAVNVNPDPSGGHWSGAPMTDTSWYGLYEALVEFDVPAMVHVSSSCTASMPTLSAHYLNSDTAVFAQLMEGDLFERFPTLRLVIPHGGGAVPYHWGRMHGLAARAGRPDRVRELMRNVFFDTAVYHRAGMELLVEVVGIDNLLFASEMLGAVRGVDPTTGRSWDDTLAYVDQLLLDDAQRARLLSDNARFVYPALDRRLAAAADGQAPPGR